MILHCTAHHPLAINPSHVPHNRSSSPPSYLLLPLFSPPSPSSSIILHVPASPVRTAVPHAHRTRNAPRNGSICHAAAT
ncbi:hypothetical protein EJ05DRAFT_118503 [Pseudovirgaria hyperparasitica]|uniref:Uncharacterized protein n=1 Tax=Pseudovirgaria hyperparasitica TaxID=470096 RepID=A0A6A6VZ74_9PEZI|nr:uncharacterized protein EJ05DRAFT_118503 [Pseudovirgaria hyperparasitica]KAF2754990.1 hypothetical protein EJ05DRAFT_118503 [Pseudovirgaria hyperparasitica]